MTKGNIAGLAGILLLLIAALEGCSKTGSLQVNLTPGATGRPSKWRASATS